jgi:hypothetical protein
VEWSGEFIPEGISDAEAIALFGGIYRDGLQALRAALRVDAADQAPPA